MTDKGFEEFIADWRDAVGQAVLHFGEVEWITYEYLARFPKDKIGRFTSKQFFKARVDLIKEIMCSKEGVDDLLETLNGLLGKALKMAQDRNVIVHSPLQINVYSDKDENYAAKDELVSYRNKNKVFSLEDVQEFAEDAKKLSIDLRQLYFKLDEELFP